MCNYLLWPTCYPGPSPPCLKKNDLQVVYWHRWNEGICQICFQELAYTSTKPSYNPVQITLVVSLKQQSKCTACYTNTYGNILDITCKSQIKSHHTPGHQLSLHCQVPWDPQDRSSTKHYLPVASSKTHTAQGVASIPRPLKLGDLQSNEVSQFYRPVSTQEVAKKVCQVSNILMPPKDKFKIIFPFLLNLTSRTPNGETVCGMWAAFHIAQDVCGLQPLFRIGTKTKQGSALLRGNISSITRRNKAIFRWVYYIAQAAWLQLLTH